MSTHQSERPTLLGEAYALKDSDGWANVADRLQMQKVIVRRRRLTLTLILLALVILMAGFVIAMLLL